MQRISSANYPLTRLILPHLSFLRRRSVQLAIAVAVVLLVASGLVLLLLPMLLPIALLTAIHQAPNYVFRNFCEDVWIGDGELVLQMKDNLFRVPWDQVQSITWHGSNNPPRVRITVATPGYADKFFTFVPDLTNGRAKAKVMIENLRNQILNKAPAGL